MPLQGLNLRMYPFHRALPYPIDVALRYCWAQAANDSAVGNGRKKILKIKYILVILQKNKKSIL